MWLMLLLPPPFSLFPIIESLETNLKNMRIYEEGIVATREVYFTKGDEIFTADITEASEYRFMDKPLKNLLIRKYHEGEKFDPTKPMYTRVASDKSDKGVERKYLEAVNSTLLERMVLSYLANQRKNVRVLKCSIKD